MTQNIHGFDAFSGLLFKVQFHSHFVIKDSLKPILLLAYSVDSRMRSCINVVLM